MNILVGYGILLKKNGSLRNKIRGLIILLI
jgi:hypothetical protein